MYILYIYIYIQNVDLSTKSMSASFGRAHLRTAQNGDGTIFGQNGAQHGNCQNPQKSLLSHF